MEEVAVLIIIFGSIFGVFYLYYSTRNKERLALIEKGADASIFVSNRKKSSNYSFAKVFVLNAALLSMGIGFGILIGSILETHVGLDDEVAYPASIFITAGAALFAGFQMTKKLDQE